jgi:hypothetical protein
VFSHLAADTFHLSIALLFTDDFDWGKISSRQIFETAVFLSWMMIST